MRRTRERIEELEATLKMRNEYIEEQNERVAKLKKELAERAVPEQIKVYDDSDVEQVLRDTMVTVAEEVQSHRAAQPFGSCVGWSWPAKPTRPPPARHKRRAMEAQPVAMKS